MDTSIELTPTLFERSQEALRLAFEALDGTEALIPFTVTWKGDEVTTARFMEGDYDDSIASAMRSIHGEHEQLSAYAVVWTGYVELEERKRSAVVLEVGDRDSARSAQLAQPFAVRSDESTEAAGALLALGEAENLLHGAWSAAALSEHVLDPSYTTTEERLDELIDQPLAQLPVAFVRLAAALGDEGEQTGRLEAGLAAIRGSAPTSVALTRQVFSTLGAAESLGEIGAGLHSRALLDIAVRGAQQVHQSQAKGLVWEQDVEAYFAEVRRVLDATLTLGGTAPPPHNADKLTALLERLCTP